MSRNAQVPWFIRRTQRNEKLLEADKGAISSRVGSCELVESGLDGALYPPGVNCGSNSLLGVCMSAIVLAKINLVDAGAKNVHEISRRHQPLTSC